MHETIGVTGNHPFWSLDRLEFVQVGELAIGERLQTLSGDTKWVQHKLPRPGPEPVYNLEVHGEHVYYVGNSGVLAHNSCSYLSRAITYAKGFVQKIGKLAGDHVLPKAAIYRALNNAGIKKGSAAWNEVVKFMNSSVNLRVMKFSLNSSKGMRNAVDWMKTAMGKSVPRRYIQNVLRKQYKNAQSINKIINDHLNTTRDWFDDFFK